MAATVACPLVSDEAQNNALHTVEQAAVATST
jgi:hypothetical protein